MHSVVASLTQVKAGSSWWLAPHCYCCCHKFLTPTCTSSSSLHILETETFIKILSFINFMPGQTPLNVLDSLLRTALQLLPTRFMFDSISPDLASTLTSYLSLKHTFRFQSLHSKSWRKHQSRLTFPQTSYYIGILFLSKCPLQTIPLYFLCSSLTVSLHIGW